MSILRHYEIGSFKWLPVQRILASKLYLYRYSTEHIVSAHRSKGKANKHQLMLRLYANYRIMYLHTRLVRVICCDTYPIIDTAVIIDSDIIITIIFFISFAVF